MTTRDFDLFTIGGGSGGVRASRVAAALGARVGLAEAGRLGGTCVNVGCVPKKLMVIASHFGDDFEQAAGFGWRVGERSFDWAELIRRKDAEIARLNSVYASLLEGVGVEVIAERARIVDAHTVELGGRKVTADHILVATGGCPVRPEIPGAELGLVSDDVFTLKKLPRRIAVVGAGYIAVEFAGIFRGLGSDVTLIARGPHLLRGFDEDVSCFLAEEMRKRGIQILFNRTVECLARRETGVVAELSREVEVEADAVLFATGRAPNVAGLGLDTIGVTLADSGAVVVDGVGRTSVPSVLAIGDVTDRVNLTPVAIAEGAALARALFGKDPAHVDYEGIPTAVFSQPPIATVGLTESAAQTRGEPIDVYISEFRPLRHTLSGSSERTFMKLVVDAAGGRVLGAHMVGMDAPEIVQGLAIAMKCGATKAQLDATIGIHPTAAEEWVTLRNKRPSST